MKIFQIIPALVVILFINVTGCKKTELPPYPICLEAFDINGWNTNVGCFTFTDYFPYQGNGQAIEFVNDQVGFIKYYSTLYKTVDGGITFSNEMNNIIYPINFVDFVDAYNGFGFSSKTFNINTTNYLYSTSDGGENWVLIEGILSDVSIKSIDFFDTLHGFIIGIVDGATEASLFVTLDGGNTWTIIAEHNFESSEPYIQILNSTTAYAAGDNKEIFKTTDRGNTWTLINDAGNVSSFEFLDENTGFAVEDFTNILLKTTDGGITWFQHSTVSVTTTNNAYLQFIHFSNENEGIAFSVGYYIENYEEVNENRVPYTYYSTTTDGGATWSGQLNDSFDPSYYQFPDVTTGYLWAGQNLVRLVKN